MLQAVSFVEALLQERPVDQVDARGDVVGAAVLVLQIVGVFPDIESEEGLVAECPRGVLGWRWSLEDDLCPCRCSARPNRFRTRLWAFARNSRCSGLGVAEHLRGPLRGPSAGPASFFRDCQNRV